MKATQRVRAPRCEQSSNPTVRPRTEALVIEFGSGGTGECRLKWRLVTRLLGTGPIGWFGRLPRTRARLLLPKTLKRGILAR
jgi:hypothetical protein